MGTEDKRRCYHDFSIFRIYHINFCFMKVRLNNDGQQFHQYQQNKPVPLTSNQ